MIEMTENEILSLHTKMVIAMSVNDTEELNKLILIGNKAGLDYKFTEDGLVWAYVGKS